MSEQRGGADDRSMGEILASIRRIVTDEERARRAGDGVRSRSDDVLDLTPAMRASTPGEPAEPRPEGEPLDLGRAARLVTPPPRPDFPPAPGLSVNEIEEIVRRVLREELKGPVGLEISRKVKASIREEVRRIMDEDEPLI